MRYAENFGRDARRSWRETLIAELLGLVRVRDTAYLRCELRAPWGVRLATEHTTFHIVVEGSCWLRVEGVTRLIKLSAGDLAMLPRGGTHTIGDSYPSPIINAIRLLPNGTVTPSPLRLGGTGRSTSLVCGSMQSESTATDPLLAVLPALIHVRRKRGSYGALPHTAVAQLLRELDPGRSSAEAIVARLADVVLMEAVSEYFDRNLDPGEDGWLTAIRDAQIGPALALLHTRSREPWTVASLARQVAMSRSLFAAKFARLVGEPPLRYLKRLRLNFAASSLLSSNHKLAAVAAAAGYESVASFAKAFKSHLGIPPGEYRRMRIEQIKHPAPLWQWRDGEHETTYELCG